MDIVGRVSGRRRWSDAEKLEILTKAFRPGVRVCDVIARREVSSSLIYTWRKQLREGQLAGVMPSLEMDNNIAERALRGIAIGDRNWLFDGSRAGGERVKAIHIVIQTCKANGIDPQAYVTDVIARVAGDWPSSRWDGCMPWNWMPPAD